MSDKRLVNVELCHRSGVTYTRVNGGKKFPWSHGVIGRQRFFTLGEVLNQGSSN